jgi:hypothetical protein
LVLHFSVIYYEFLKFIKHFPIVWKFLKSENPSAAFSYSAQPYRLFFYLSDTWDPLPATVAPRYISGLQPLSGGYAAGDETGTSGFAVTRRT